MRGWVFSVVVSLSALAGAQQFFTQAFQNQDFHSKQWPTIERYGKSELEIVAMGHDPFVKWFCEPGRAGVSGRMEAENVFALALNECNAPLLKKLSRREQKFMEDVYSTFADMAKSSFVTGILATSESDAWSLPIKESSTAVGAAVYSILNPAFQPPTTKLEDLDKLHARVAARMRAKNPAHAEDGGRLKYLAGVIEKLFAPRPKREREIAQRFTVDMVKLALLDPVGQ